MVAKRLIRPPPQQKPTAPTLPLAPELGEIGEARLGIGCRQRRVEIGEHVARLVLVLGRAAERRQEVRRQRDKTFQCHTARHVTNMRIEATVFVDDDDAAELAGRILRTDEIPLHLALAAGVGDILAFHPVVVGGDDLGTRLVGGKQRRDGGGSSGRARKLRQLFHEAPTIERQMRIFVIGVDHRLRHDGLVRAHGPVLPIFLRQPARCRKPPADKIGRRVAA